MDLVELCAQLESGEFDPEPDSGESTATFYCDEAHYGIIPTPRPAATHYDVQQKNFTRPKKLHATDLTHTSTDEHDVEPAMRTGWILAYPADLYINPTAIHNNNVPAHDFPNYLRPYRELLNGDGAGAPFLVDTQWFIDLPDGYSLLLTTPVNYHDTRFTVIPRVLDADDLPMRITIPVIPHANETTITTGTPLAQAIPVNRETTETTATIGVFQPGESPPDTEPSADTPDTT